jgi:hypothetical protein
MDPENTSTETEVVDDADAFTSAFSEALGIEPPEGEVKPAAVAKEEAAPSGETDEAASAVAAASDGGDEVAAAGTTDEEPAAEEAEAAAEEEPAPERAAKPAPAEPAAAEAQFYTEAEQAAIDEYEKDWADVRKAEALIRKREYHSIVKHIFDEVQRVYGPVAEYMNAAQDVDHESAIYGAHEDLDEIRPGLLQWVNKQPAFLKKTYKGVIEEGTAEDVIALVSSYKKESGIKTEAAPQATSVASAAPAGAGGKAAGASPKAQQAAQRLSAVGTKRSAVGSSAADPTDFSGAFKEATSGS